MAHKLFLNQWIYNALIEKNLNGFTVTELRNLILANENVDLTKQGLSVFVRRQLNRLLVNGYLLKQESCNPRLSKYFKTPLLVLDDVTPGVRTRVQETSTPCTSNFLTRINHDREQSEAELTIILGEVEEYKRVLSLYPRKTSKSNL